MKPKQINKKFVVTCPFCEHKEEKVYKLTLDELNTLSFVCPKCERKVHTGSFFLPKDYDKKKP